MVDKEEHLCHNNRFPFVFVLQRPISTARIHLNLFSNIDPLEVESNELAAKCMQSFWPSFRSICENCSGVIRCSIDSRSLGCVFRRLLAVSGEKYR